MLILPGYLHSLPGSQSQDPVSSCQASSSCRRTMTSTILSCSVWCEVHGPTNIFCTQALDSQAPATVPPTKTPATPPSTPLQPPKSPGVARATSSASKGTCASCSPTLPAELQTEGVAPFLRTVDRKITYLSTRHPSNQERYKAVRSACIRALSCESVPGRSGPVFFGDPSIGYTIAYIFRLSDGPLSSTTISSTPVHLESTSTNTFGARSTTNSMSGNGSHDGGRRQFALMCTSTEERDLLQSWTFITERFRVIVSKLVNTAQANNAIPAPTDENTSSISASMAGENTGTPFKRTEALKRSNSKSKVKITSFSNPHTTDRSFLRPKGRQAEKGLAELIGMDDIFVQLHASFAWMLHVWRLHFDDVSERKDVGSVPDSSDDRAVSLLRDDSISPGTAPKPSHNVSLGTVKSEGREVLA